MLLEWILRELTILEVSNIYFSTCFDDIDFINIDLIISYTQKMQILKFKHTK